MNVLITGAGGFVGRSLLSLADKIGGRVVALSRRPIDVSPSVELHVVADLLQFDAWGELLSGIDVVIHCAGLAHTTAEESRYYDVNTEITIRLAEACVVAGVRRFIFLSSLKVLGEHTLEGRPFTSRSLPNPAEAYGKSKYLAEQRLLALGQESNLEVVVIRPPLIYGVGVKANFQKLIGMARLPVPLPFGSVNNKRDMVSLFNLFDLIECCLVHPSAAGQVLMVSDGKPYSLAELISVAREVDERPRWLVSVPVKILRFFFSLLKRKEMAGRLFDNLEVDITETERLLNWKPKETLRDTLRSISA